MTVQEMIVREFDHEKGRGTDNDYIRGKKIVDNFATSPTEYNEGLKFLVEWLKI